MWVKSPEQGVTCRFVEIVGPFSVQQSEVETGHAGHCLVFHGSRWSSQRRCEEKAQCRPTTHLLIVTGSGPPLGSVAPTVALTNAIVTSSPSLKYGPREGRTLGMGIAMVLWA